MNPPNNDKLPWDVRQQVLWIVRGYERQKREYLRSRMEILSTGGDRSATYTVNGEERREYLPSAHNASRTTENVATRLAALDETTAVRQIRAVERARYHIGDGLPAELADKLREAVWMNCMDGRKYPFERLYVVGLERTTFYRRRNEFLRQIAAEMGLF